MDLGHCELLEEGVSTTDLEVAADLRESIDRVWAQARRLGIFSIDEPLRRQLRELRPANMKLAAAVKRRRGRRQG